MGLEFFNDAAAATFAASARSRRPRQHVPFDLRLELGLGGAQVERRLQVEPELAGRTEVAREAQRGVRGDSPPLVHNVVDPGGGDSQRLCQRVRAQTERAEKLFAQHFAGVDGAHGFLWHDGTLVIVDDLYVPRAAVGPAKAQPPLVVDADAVLALAVAGKLLKPIAGWRAKVSHIGSTVEHLQFAFGSRANRPPARRATSLEDAFGVAIAERADHWPESV